MSAGRGLPPREDPGQGGGREGSCAGRQDGDREGGMRRRGEGLWTAAEMALRTGPQGTRAAPAGMPPPRRRARGTHVASGPARDGGGGASVAPAGGGGGQGRGVGTWAWSWERRWHRLMMHLRLRD